MMKGNAEYRAEAWKRVREGHWVAKFVLVWMVMLTIYGIVQGMWNGAVESFGIQTWSAFLEAKAKAIAGGLDLTVPSRTIAIRMTEASAFEMFVNCIVSGIFSFAMFSLFLCAAKGGGAWFRQSFGGFKRPLGVAWLYFRYVLQVSLWTLLFVVPGIVAAYRYCQCWNLKVENPDWSAGKCLAESGRMMNGHKWARFSLDCSYWKPITLLLIGMLALTVMMAGGSSSPSALYSSLFTLTALVCIWGCAVLAVYMSIGQAMFYLDLKSEGEK